MGKLQRVAITAAAVACMTTLGAGVSFADGYGPGPQAGAWAVSQSAAGAVAQGGAPQAAAPQAAPQAPAPQAAPQAPAPQAAPQAPAPQAAPQGQAPQAPAPQAAPQGQAPQAPAPQGAPQGQAPQPAPQGQAPQAAPQGQAPQADSGGRRTGLAQHTQCKSHDLNISILGQAGLLNGALGNALNGEGSPGNQQSQQGSRMGCNNAALSK